MAKKKYDVDQPETWSEEQVNKYIIDSVKEIGIALPWKEIALAGLFTYGYWKAFGAGALPTKEDIMLGVFYALTLPSALEGGLLANAYALGILQVLGVGLVGGDVQAKLDALTDDERVGIFAKLPDFLQKP